MKVEDVNVQYTIPGHQSDLSELAETGDADELDDAPFNQTYQQEMPSLGGWKQLLGLSRVSPDPTQIDPPPKPAHFDGSVRSDAEDTYRRLLESHIGRESTSQSPRIKQMLDLLSAHQRAVDEIKARAVGSGGSR
ncbi:MAG TPA: hypothetical protein VHZ55_00835 [Bryobacteraceae bacterium]|jgi:hypothetical protein|nr:hypothetical protein [Bryobacteraceae bacterium]